MHLIRYKRISTLAKVFVRNSGYYQSRYSSSKNSHSFDYAGLFIFGGISFGTSILGVWQLQRYYEKINAIAAESHQIHQDMIKLPDNLHDDDLKSWIDHNISRRLQLEGSFDHDHEVKLGLRSAPSGVGTQAQGLASNPQGFYIITPFRLLDGRTIYINRGWVPRFTESYDRPAGKQHIEVILSQTEKEGLFSPKNVPASKTLLWLEAKALLEATHSPTDIHIPLIFESYMTSRDGFKGLPIPKSQAELQTQHVTPLTHLVYSATWFSLAAAGFAMTYSMFRKRSKTIKPRNNNKQL